MRSRWRHRSVSVVVVVLALVASGCRIVMTPSQGFQVFPDNPVSGRRVLLFGDSLVRQPSLSFGVGLEPAGAEVLIDATNTGGLVSGPVRWEDLARERLVSFRPSDVVIGFYGSFAPPYWAPYAPPYAAGTPQYDAWVAAQPGTADFAQRNLDAVRRLSRIFLDAGVRVWWIAPVPFPPQYGWPSLPERLWAQWTGVFATEMPTVRMLNANASIAPTGFWTDHLWFCGQDRLVRSTGWDGGVHFTSDGAGRYGRALARAMTSAAGWPAPVAHCGD